VSDAGPASVDRTPSGPPTIACPFCQMIVPDARFCGACGAHLSGDTRWHAQRLHAYAAFPEEPVVRLSVTTTLFPHLSHRGKAPFRAALGTVMALIVVFAIAGTAAPLMAVCAFGVPLLFLLYIFEVDPYEGSFILPTTLAVVVGAGLGTGWSLLSSGYVNRALLPSVTGGLGTGRSLVSGIVVPVVAEVLMCVTIPAVHLIQRGSTESLDGFVVGASGALGFTFAATIVLLRPWLSDGQLLNSPFVNTLAQGVDRGIAWPLISALGTGLVGAGFWATTGRATAARGRWLASPVLALTLAVVLQCGTALADLAGLPDADLLVVQVAILVVLLVVMRIGIHHVLMHEAGQVVIGAAGSCGHCGHLVPAMAFCPQCGVATRATSRRTRRPEASEASEAEATLPAAPGAEP